MKLSLNCFVLGDTDTFTANVPEKYTNDNLTELEYSALTVSNFTEIIKNQVKHAVDPDDPSSMKLWQVDIDDESLKNIFTEKDIENKFNGKMMKRAYPFSDYFPDGTVPTLRNIHIIIVPVTDTPNKRIKLEVEDLSLGLVQTKTIEYLQDLLHPFDEPVSRNNIDQYLNAPLRKKLPAHYFHCRQYPDFLDYRESIYLPDVTAAVDSAMELFKDKRNQEMETSYMIDNIIRKMFKVVEIYISKSGLEWVRNNKVDDFTTTTNKRVRPDVLVYCRNVLVMMGEEKAAHTTLQTAAEELNEYFSFWNTLAFGDLPLVIAFAADGTQIQFYYYHVVGPSKKPRRETIGDVLSLGTDVKLNNLDALRYTINIIRIIRTFDQCGVIQTPLLKLFNQIHRDNNTTITIYPEIVKKTIEKTSIVNETLHETLYSKILPSLGHYKDVKYSTTKNKIYLTFGPVGYLSIPRSENDLRLAMFDILEIVSKLHNEEVVHRDIRWENVVKLTDDKWLLIDFEEAAKIGEERITLRIAAPEYENANDICQASGDIWMIGKLMNDYRIKFTLSKRAKKFRDRLMSEDSNQRPTAIDALNDDWFEKIGSDDLME